jgi:hypothetical protein
MQATGFRTPASASRFTALVFWSNSEARLQALAACLHEAPGLCNVVSRELAVALNDVASNEHSLDVGRARPKHHGGDSVAEVVEMRGPHVDDRDVGALTPV